MQPEAFREMILKVVLGDIKSAIPSESRDTKDSNSPLTKISSRDVDLGTDGFARYDEFNPPILLSSGGIVV